MNRRSIKNFHDFGLRLAALLSSCDSEISGGEGAVELRSFCVPLGPSDWAARFSALAQIIFKKRYYQKLAIRKRFETRAWLATRVYTLVIMKNTIYQRKRRKRMNLWEILLLVGFTSAERGNLIFQTIFINFIFLNSIDVDRGRSWINNKPFCVLFFVLDFLIFYTISAWIVISNFAKNT